MGTGTGMDMGMTVSSLFSVPVQEENSSVCTVFASFYTYIIVNCPSHLYNFLPSFFFVTLQLLLLVLVLDCCCNCNPNPNANVNVEHVNHVGVNAYRT